MAEVFEIQILNKKQISFKSISDTLRDAGFFLSTIKCIDDWTYSNTKNLEQNEIDTIDMLSEEKIIVLEGELLKNNSGVFISKEGQTYCYDFWISTNNLRSLAIESIDKDNSKIYSIILDILLMNINKNDLVCCAMGVETSIDKEDAVTVNTIIENSTGVVRWIMPENETVCLKEYKEERINNFRIYSLYN